MVDLRADVNRDGVVDLSPGAADDVDEDTWDATHGAVFLANIDDDQKQCPYSNQLSDVQLAKCNDAADEVINGDDDLLDLAWLKSVPWPQAPDTATATVTVTLGTEQYVRLFRESDGALLDFAPGTTLDAAALRSGLVLAIEARDIVRDTAKWDGYVDVSLTVSTAPGTPSNQILTDTVRLRVSPVMLFHHLEKAETVFVTDAKGDPDSPKFQADIVAAANAAGTANPVYKVYLNRGYPDQWTQDFFENGYMAMPAPDGQQHVIRVAYRSANIYHNSTSNPLRDYGRIVYLLRGKDVAAVQEYDLKSDPSMDTLNSFGNTEIIPPYTLGDESFPLGRLFRGSVPSFHPDKAFSKMLESQKVQPPVYVDTSWLLVGHVDETFTFLKVNSPRGWIVLVNDPALARQMLEAEVAKGNGDVTMFKGQYWYDDNFDPYPAEVSINDVLADADVMNESASAAVEVAAQLDIVRGATGITDAEIVRVPYLHEPFDGYSVAYQPGTANMLVLSDSVVAVPDPHGPEIGNVDIFKKQMEDALAPYGYTIRWVDDWNLYHALSGEVHCGTNAARSIPEQRWWESGR
ncbi:MAG: protein-arginine deiminase [Myxococcaceae bacterium]|nr:protein-arginine deiminase [Myxococcaceae bacterium]